MLELTLFISFDCPFILFLYLSVRLFLRTHFFPFSMRSSQKRNSPSKHNFLWSSLLASSFKFLRRNVWLIFDGDSKLKNHMVKRKHAIKNYNKILIFHRGFLLHLIHRFPFITTKLILQISVRRLMRCLPVSDLLDVSLKVVIGRFLLANVFDDCWKGNSKEDYDLKIDKKSRWKTWNFQLFL